MREFETHEISSDAVIFGVDILDFPALSSLEKKRGVPVPSVLLGAKSTRIRSREISFNK